MYGNIDVLDIKKIQEKVSDYDLFKHYAGDFILNKAICSPLREDKKPSFCIYSNGSSLKFKDFGTGDTGSIFDFIMLKFNCNFKKSLEIVKEDFKNNFSNNFRNNNYSYCKDNKIEISIPETVIEIKKRKWLSVDKNFWEEYNIDFKTLEKFNIFPISHAWINKNIVIYPKNGDIHYAYRFGNKIYKIYSPNSKEKWLSNAKSFHIQGYNQLPLTGNLVIITKSLKDVIVLYKLGFTSIAPQSESNFVREELIKELKKRFKKILVLYDDDETGNNSAKRILKQYEIPNIKITRCKEFKDISDYVKVRGYEEGLKKIQELIIFKGLINFI